MSRYDYQDNPQVQYWKEIVNKYQMAYEKLSDEISKSLAKQICEEVEKAKQERESMKLENETLRQEKKAAEEYCKEMEMKNKELQEDIALFNSLPWYEKIFHKFD